MVIVNAVLGGLLLAGSCRAGGLQLDEGYLSTPRYSSRCGIFKATFITGFRPTPRTKSWSFEVRPNETYCCHTSRIYPAFKVNAYTIGTAGVVDCLLEPDTILRVARAFVAFFLGLFGCFSLFLAFRDWQHEYQG